MVVVLFVAFAEMVMLVPLGKPRIVVPGGMPVPVMAWPMARSAETGNERKGGSAAVLLGRKGNTSDQIAAENALIAPSNAVALLSGVVSVAAGGVVPKVRNPFVLTNAPV